jgi:hypothetical protein
MEEVYYLTHDEVCELWCFFLVTHHEILFIVPFFDHQQWY